MKKFERRKMGDSRGGFCLYPLYDTVFLMCEVKNGRRQIERKRIWISMTIDDEVDKIVV